MIHAVSTKTFKALDKDLQCSPHYDCWNSVLGAINRSAVKKEVPWSNNWEMLPMTTPLQRVIMHVHMVKALGSLQLKKYFS